MIKKIIFALLLITTSFLYAQKVESVTAVKGVTTSGDTVYVEYVVNILDDLLITADGDTIKLFPGKDLYMIDIEVDNSRIFSLDSLGNLVAVGKISTEDSIHTDLGLKIRNLDLYYGAGNRLRTSNSLILDDSLFVGTVSTLDRINLNGPTGIGGTLTMRGGDINMNEYGILNATSIQSTLYGSNNSISDAELLGIDDGTTAQIPVGGGAGSAMVWTTATGTGAPVRAGSPTFTGTTTAPKVKATTGVKTGKIDFRNQTSLQTTIGTDSSEGYFYDDGSNVHDMVRIDDNTTETDRERASKQDVINGEVGTSLSFDGGDDFVNISHNANLDINNDITIMVMVYINNYSDYNTIVHKCVGSGTADNTYELRTNITTGTVGFLGYDTGLKMVTSTKVVPLNTWTSIIAIRNAGTATIYINGVADGTVGMGTTTSNANDVQFGKRNTNLFFDGMIKDVRIFNNALSTSEIQNYPSSIPYKYIGASQTEKMPNQVDRDFSGASAWSNVDLNAYDETTDLTITATAAAQYCTCPVASAPRTIGKQYRMTFSVANLVSTWTIKSFDGVQTIGTVTANGAQSFKWTSTTTGGYRIVAVSTTSSGDFDNFTLKRIGCVAQYEPSGINSATWVDASGNGLTGTISGATVVNPLIQVYTPGNVLGATYGNGNVSYAELNYLSEVTSDIQAQLDALGGGILSADLTVDSSYSIVSMIYDTVGAVIYVGDFVYSPADGDYELASASASTTFPCTGLVCRTNSADKPTYILQEGYIRLNSWNWTKTGGVGDLLYLSTTAGDATQTAPSGANEYIQIIGRVIGPDVIYFNPSLNWVKHE